jgi:hypothetical protein
MRKKNFAKRFAKFRFAKFRWPRYAKIGFKELLNEWSAFLVSYRLIVSKEYKGGYRLASKIKDKGFEADLYTKH